jgi:cellulose synthase operon protein B
MTDGDFNVSMNKASRVFSTALLAASLCATLSLAAVDDADAQDPAPRPAGTGLLVPDDEPFAAGSGGPPGDRPETLLPAAGDILSFSQLGFTAETLSGPFDSSRLSLRLPLHWLPAEGAALQLDLTTIATSFTPAGGGPTTEGARGWGGSLKVEFNGQTLATIPLDQLGERSFSIPISPAALVSARSDGRHDLDLFLDSGLSCDSLVRTDVLVRATSFFVLPHRLVSPPTDLTRLPSPIFQRSFLPDLATIILPDQPTKTELQAALTVAAAFGQMTNGKLQLSFTPLGQLTAAVRGSQHLIFVGKLASFPLLEDVPLPLSRRESGVAAKGTAPDDGIIQLAVSPWDSARVVLVVGGRTDEAVAKAAQAISTGTVRATPPGNLALVADVFPQTIADRVPPVDRTLADLGYSLQTADRLGWNSIEVRFEFPPGRAVDNDAYLDLNFSHSALLDYDQSGLLVTLNDEPVGSTRFSDDSTRPARTRIAIPPSSVRRGVNRLLLQINLSPDGECIDYRQGGLWFSLRPESVLHLPLNTEAGPIVEPIDLDRYPNPFNQSTSLSNLAFVLPDDDPAAWRVAAEIAFDLGKSVGGAFIDLAVAYGHDVPDIVRQSRDLIVVGRPSTLPLIAELETALPAPFEPGSDLATEPDTRVSYRLPAGVSLGYLELLKAPWNDERAILAVLGTAGEGLAWSGRSLTEGDLRGQLAGDFTVINGEQIISMDTRLSAGSGSELVLSMPDGGPGPAAGNGFPIVERPAWVLPVLVLSTALMFVVAGLVMIVSWRQRRTVR